MKEAVIVSTNQKMSTINRDIYGHFAEHLGRCIYGGFWVGKDSPIENIDGYRKDVVEAFKKIKIPNLRWPGGCFADEYHWKDGIGPKETRKRMVNTHWGGVVEDNSFGTHEFMNLCELLECKPYICGNLGSGTVQEMSEWVEYITFAGESPMSKLREKNGAKKPWKLPLFGVGNESWGCGGNMNAQYYADLYRRYQTYVRQYGKDKIFKIACGPCGPDYNWTEVLMKEDSKLMDGLSLHHYTFEVCWDEKGDATKFDKNGYYSTIKNAFEMDEILRRHSEVMDKYDKEKRVALVVDEWGCWFNVEEGTNPGFLYQQGTIRDALVAGISLNIFNNHSDRVRIANLAQAVNVLQSPVLTEGDKIVLTPTYHVLDMYKNHQDATLLNTTIASKSATNGEIFVPGISASASVIEDKNHYTITICNTDMESSKNISLSLAALQGAIKTANATVLQSPEITAFNSFDKPETIKPKALNVQITQNDTVDFSIPAASIASIILEC